MELTDDEKKVILEIAARSGKDRDGDILSFFVKEDEKVVDILELDKYTIKGEK